MALVDLLAEALPDNVLLELQLQPRQLPEELLEDSFLPSPRLVSRLQDLELGQHLPADDIHDQVRIALHQ